MGNLEDWEKRWAKQWDSLDCIYWAYLKTLEPRLKMAEDRYEKLSDASLAYENATEDPTPLEEARLDRMIRIHDKANAAADRLEERIEIVKKIASLHEDEVMLAEKKYRNSR